MKKIFALSLSVLMAMGLLAGCGGGSKPAEKTPEELTALYAEAINASGCEMVQYNPVISAASEEDGSAFLLETLGLNPEDMAAFGISASMMNVKAYAIAAVRPAEGKEETVTSALQNFIDLQKRNFEMYLADQYGIACAAKLETLEDGTVLLVMCEGQDEVFESIKTAILA